MIKTKRKAKPETKATTEDLKEQLVELIGNAPWSGKYDHRMLTAMIRVCKSYDGKKPNAPWMSRKMRKISKRMACLSSATS